MNRLAPLFIFVTFFALLQHADAATQQDTPPQISRISDEKVDAEMKNQQEMYYLYLKAEYQHNQAQVEGALSSYHMLFDQKPKIYAYDGYIGLLFNIGNFAKIVEVVEKNQSEFDTLLKNHTELQMTIGQAYLHINQDDKAAKIFLDLAQHNPDNDQIAYYTAIAQIKGNKLNDALKFLNTCLERPGLRSRHFLFQFLKSKIFLQQHDFVQAGQCIEKSLELFPKFDRGWLLKAMLLEQQGKINEAIGGYKQFLDIVGRDVNVEKQLIQLLFAQKKFQEAAVFLKKIKNNSAEYYFDLAVLEQRAGNFDAALTHIDESLTRDPNFKTGILLKLELLINQKKVDQAIEFMQSLLEKNSNDDFSLHTLLLLRKAKVPTEKIIALLENLIHQKKHSFKTIAMLADLYIETNKFHRGLLCYNKLLSAASQNELKSKILYQIGYIYFCTGKTDNVEKALNAAIRINPMYPPVYNLLAYHYAKTNQKISTALNLIDKAIEITPDCPYSLDTKGFILLKQGNAGDALSLFKKALALAPHDKVIKQHVSMAQKPT